jgi:hypothetical protein
MPQRGGSHALSLSTFPSLICLKVDQTHLVGQFNRRDAMHAEKTRN